MSAYKKDRLLVQSTGIALAAVLAAECMAPTSAQAEQVVVDAAVLEQLQQLIKQQQQQLNKQSRQIQTQSATLQSLQTQVGDLQKTTSETQTIATKAQSTASEAQSTASDAQSTAQEAKMEVAAKNPAEDGPVVTSGQDKVRLAISGQINRMVNVADDGDKTKYYNVDNSNSNSRIRFVGTGEVTEDVTIGTQIELAIGPNQSSKVSQDNEDDGDFFDQRKVEAWVDSKRLGRLTLGKGSTASDGTAEVDLSQTDVIGYSSISDTAGGLKFRDSDDNLTTTTIGNTFNNFDGLGRQNRVRYDSPGFYGFSLGGSTSSDQRYDGAVRWGGQGYGFKIASAAALADPNQNGVDYQLNGSVSALHESTGLNLTLSAGTKDTSNQGNPQNFYAKGGWIADFFDFGKTAMSVDYTRSVNLPTRGDDGYSVGAAVVQKIPVFGSELYAQFRIHDLSRDNDPNVQKIYVGSSGARVKF
jgi:hypothetical protein